MALLSSATSRILLNGVPGCPIKHGQGLRQGDPLSPLLFDIAIDPLQAILERATTSGALHSLRGRITRMRTSLYADDAVIFLAPIKEDVEALSRILNGFGEVTGLIKNVQKSSFVPIQCNGLDLDAILQDFPALRSHFPIRYLGLPLSVFRLRGVDFQFIVDKMARKLPIGHGKMVSTAGRVALIKSVTTSQAIYPLTVLAPPKNIMKAFINIERAFLWAASDKVSGGKCKVKWEVICSPKDMGGLGVLNLQKFARALRLRWPWFEWNDPTRPWVGLGLPCDAKDMELFYASVTISIGDGKTIKFRDASWLEGLTPKSIAPSASKPDFFEIKPALLTLVMKEQFSGVRY